MVSGRRRDATSPSLLSLKRTAGLALLAPSPCSLPLSTERTNELVVESAESGLDYGGSTGLNRPKEATPFFPQRRDSLSSAHCSSSSPPHAASDEKLFILWCPAFSPLTFMFLGLLDSAR